MSRNGVMAREPGLILRKTGQYLSFGAESDTGVDSTRTTSGVVSRQTGKIYVFTPLIVSAVLWDIHANNTFTCQFVTTLTGTTSVFVVAAATALVAGADVVIPCATGDFVLMPGTHYLQLSIDGGGTEHFLDSSGPRYVDMASWATNAMAYNTTVADPQYLFPVKLRARPAVLNGLVPFGRL